MKELLINKPTTLQFNRYVPVAILYLFFNSVGLPEGLLFTTFLTPIFLLQNLSNNLYRPILLFILLTLIYACIHFAYPINLTYYMRSWVMAFCNLQFCLVIFTFVSRSHNPGQVFKSLVYLNFLLVLLASIGLNTDWGRNTLWYLIPVSPGIDPYPRLKLFTSEASVYSLMIAPLFFYYLIRFFKNKGQFYGFALITLIISLILSFSLGVLSCITIAGIVLVISNPKLFFSDQRMKRNIIFISLLLISISSVYFYLNPDNIFLARLNNIIHGNDTSARGRTYESFLLAWRMIHDKSVFFGIGLGQIKETGRSVVLEYYRYSNIPATIRIPNACAEILTYFGLSGLFLKIGAEIFLFFRCKVMKDPFRISLFVFIFIYQFTGSYLTNIAEYVLWILAFVPLSNMTDSIINGEEIG